MVHHAVTIGVELLQGLKTVSRPASVGQDIPVAEQLAPVIDLPVAVVVPHQQGIVRPDPAGLFSEAVAVVVEVSTIVKPHRLHPITIQVQDDRAGLGERKLDIWEINGALYIWELNIPQSSPICAAAITSDQLIFKLF